jgi:hypothetical protein
MTTNGPIAGDILARAREYPYRLPKSSYILYKGQELPARDYDVAYIKSRVGVLAFGSNGSPDQLRRKFADTGNDEELIPVYKIILTGFDVVFGARFSGYGAIPAVLVPSKGTVLETFVTYLNKSQLKVMHNSELGPKLTGVAYNYGRIDGVHSIVDLKGIVESLHVYHAPGGALTRDGSMVAVADVVAKNRTLLDMRHSEFWDQTRQMLGGGDAQTFAERLVSDEDYRLAQSAILKKDSQNIRLPNYKKILPKPRSRR